jgi:hypothetical protein
MAATDAIRRWIEDRPKASELVQDLKFVQTTRPLRSVRGGAGSRRSMKSRSWSRAGIANYPGLLEVREGPAGGLLDDHVGRISGPGLARTFSPFARLAGMG